MTTPDFSEIIPLKYKTYVGLIGSLLSFVGPFILQSTDALPSPWPVLVGLLFATLTTLGIYKAPYKPVGTTLAVDPTQGSVVATTDGSTPVAVPAADVSGEVLWSSPEANPYKNPWKQ